MVSYFVSHTFLLAFCHAVGLDKHVYKMYCNEYCLIFKLCYLLLVFIVKPNLHGKDRREFYSRTAINEPSYVLLKM